MASHKLAGSDRYRRAMEIRGYVRGSHEGDSARLFFCKGMPRIFHVHIVGQSGEEHHKHVMSSGCLRKGARARADCAALKRSLARRLGNDRELYVQGKSKLIESILQGIRRRYTRKIPPRASEDSN